MSNILVAYFSASREQHAWQGHWQMLWAGSCMKLSRRRSTVPQIWTGTIREAEVLSK